MNTPKQRQLSKAEELEQTAELPILPGTFAAEPAHDETVVMAHVESPSRADTARVDTARVDTARTDTFRVDSRLDSRNDNRNDGLESNLRSLTESLRTLEEKLRTKTEELTVFEREVGTRDRRIADLDRELALQVKTLEQANATNSGLVDNVTRLTGALASAEQSRDQHATAHAAIERERASREAALQLATSRLGELDARAQRQLEVLQSSEGVRQIYEGMVAERELQMEALQDRMTLLDKDALTRAEQVAMREQALQSAADTQRSRAETAEQSLAQARGRIGELEQAVRQAQLAHTEARDTLSARIQALEAEMADAARRSAAREQALQSSVELQTGRASSLERDLAQARTRIGSLELEAQQLRQSGEQRQQSDAQRLQELERSLAAAADLASQQQRELSDKLAAEQKLVAEQTGSINELRREYAATQTQLAEANQGVARQEIELRDHMELIRALQEQMVAANGRADALAGDLAAAEERIRTAQNDLRQRDVRIDRLGGIEAELRSQLEAVGRQLDERNALISRLEGEAASSAAVLGNIQQNLERLSTENAAPASVAAAAPSDQTARLLVRTEGDTGIVHVLGRRTTIGRTPDNDLRIDADFISRHHAVILTTNNVTVIEDLDSTNGVYINGVRISRRALAEGDLVTVGRTEFRFVLKPVPDRAS